MNKLNSLQETIEKAWDDRSLLKDENTTAAIREVIDLLDKGTLRVVFGCIADEVEDDLGRAAPVCLNNRLTRRQIDIKGQPASLHNWISQSAYFFKQLRDIDRFKFDLFCARFNAGDIEQVIDQGQKVPPCFCDLVDRIADLKWIVVGSESDALLLENNLIKKHQPRYNIQSHVFCRISIDPNIFYHLSISICLCHAFDY